MAPGLTKTNIFDPSRPVIEHFFKNYKTFEKYVSDLRSVESFWYGEEKNAKEYEKKLFYLKSQTRFFDPDFLHQVKELKYALIHSIDINKEDMRAYELLIADKILKIRKFIREVSTTCETSAILIQKEYDVLSKEEDGLNKLRDKFFFSDEERNPFEEETFLSTIKKDMIIMVSIYVSMLKHLKPLGDALESINENEQVLPRINGIDRAIDQVLKGYVFDLDELKKNGQAIDELKLVREKREDFWHHIFDKMEFNMEKTKRLYLAKREILR